MSNTVQLMIVAPCHRDTIGPLTDALSRFDVACVLIASPTWQPGEMRGDDVETTEPEALDQDVCRALVDLVQNHETAAIVANDTAAAAATHADGCHLDTTSTLEDQYGNTRQSLGESAIVGVMPGASRHMAMTLADAGADYVGYAVNGVDDAAGLEFITWWAEIFASPVVAFTDGDSAICRRAIEAGPPDFLSCPLLVNGAIDHLRDVSQLIDDIGQLPTAAKDAK